MALGSSFETKVARQETTSGGVIGGYSRLDGGGNAENYASYNPDRDTIVNDRESGEVRRYTDYDGGAPPDFGEADAQRIRSQVTAQMQGELDAIEERFTTLAAQEERTAADRSGRTRALGARSGLIGSARGDAQAQKTENLNKEAMKALQAEKAAEIQSVYGRIDQRAREAIALESQQAQMRRDEYLGQLKERRDQAREDLAVFAKGGLTIDEIDPADLNELMKDSGLNSRLLVESYINGNRPEQAKTNYQYKTVGNRIIAYGVNPNGELVTLEDQLPFDVPENYKVVSTDNGQFLFVPDEFDPTKDPREQVLTYGAPGQFSKPKAGGEGESDQLYGGLSSSTATAVRAKVNAYKSEPMVTNFSTIQDGYNFAKSINTNTKNPADDQALIYSLAKALDPGSVVREGEYATAQKYAQSWVDAYGKAVTQAIAGTGFLSKQARENIKKVIEQKYNASKTSYDKVNTSYISNINNLTGRGDGKKFLTDYVTSSAVRATGPDGEQYEFDPSDLTEEDRQVLIDGGYTFSD